MAVTAGCSKPPAQAQINAAEIIYTGGDIVTINDRQPSAEALAVKGGKILAVGKKDDVFKLKDDATKVIDLGGKTLVPGFLDAHGHFMSVGIQRSVANLLPPPDGKGDSIAGLQALLKEWRRATPPGASAAGISSWGSATTTPS
jgi:predicted amidohydrolase YtcJ